MNSTIHTFARPVATAFAALVASTFCLAAAAVPAKAGELSPHVVQVSTAGVDMQSLAGRALIQRQIAGAAATVCGVREAYSLQDQMAAAKCARETIANTRPQLLAMTSLAAR